MNKILVIATAFLFSMYSNNILAFDLNGLVNDLANDVVKDVLESVDEESVDKKTKAGGREYSKDVNKTTINSLFGREINKAKGSVCIENVNFENIFQNVKEYNSGTIVRGDYDLFKSCSFKPKKKSRLFSEYYIIYGADSNIVTHVIGVNTTHLIKSNNRTEIALAIANNKHCKTQNEFMEKALAKKYNKPLIIKEERGIKTFTVDDATHPPMEGKGFGYGNHLTYVCSDVISRPSRHQNSVDFVEFYVLTSDIALHNAVEKGTKIKKERDEKKMSNKLKSIGTDI